MATVIRKSAKKEFPAFVGEFWNVSQHLLEIYRWIFENLVNKNYSSLLKLGQTRVFIIPKITEKREKREREREREKKTNSNSL